MERAAWRELAGFARRNPVSVAGGVVGLLIVLVALTAPWISPRDPLKTDFRRMNRAPDAHAVFGTDQVGRDTLSRVIYGARTSLFVAFSAVLLGTTTGSLWGVACGYLGGRFDLVSQRVMEVLQAFPDLILAMAISMAIGTGLPAVIVAIAITRLPFGGRVIRSVALSVRDRRRDHGAGAPVVAGALSRPVDHRHRARLQSAGRRHPRHARPQALPRSAASGHWRRAAGAGPRGRLGLTGRPPVPRLPSGPSYGIS